MSSLRRHLSLLSAVLLLTACGGAEEPLLEMESPAPALEASDVEGNVEAFSACTVTLACANGSNLQCSSAVGNCTSTSTTVTCDGATQACPPASCAPLTRTIRQGIGACYPPSHPFGRYYINSPESGVTYSWTSNYAELHWTTGPSMNLSATSVGYFTLYVTASRPGCAQTTSFWADFYASDCS